MIESYGGSIDATRFEVPGVVVLGLFKDPAGNEMGLVEMDGDKHKIPWEKFFLTNVVISDLHKIIRLQPAKVHAIYHHFSKIVPAIQNNFFLLYP